jgi:hypothetical protein
MAGSAFFYDWAIPFLLVDIPSHFVKIPSELSSTKQIWKVSALSVYNLDRHLYADNQEYFGAIPIFLLQF